MEKLTNIDCMKFRKSTHLAGVDVDAIVAEKGKCILTIKETYYSKGVDVSGNKTDGYFIEFIEDVKPMLVNSVNRKTIANIVKTKKQCSSAESRNISNWIGLTVELYFDENVKMMGKMVGGIRVKPESPIIKVDDSSALQKLESCTTLEELQAAWNDLSTNEKNYPTVIAKKDQLKSTLK